MCRYVDTQSSLSSLFSCINMHARWFNWMNASFTLVVVRFLGSCPDFTFQTRAALQKIVSTESSKTTKKTKNCTDKQHSFPLLSGMLKHRCRVLLAWFFCTEQVNPDAANTSVGLGHVKAPPDSFDFMWCYVKRRQMKVRREKLPPLLLLLRLDDKQRFFFLFFFNTATEAQK